MLKRFPHGHPHLYCRWICVERPEGARLIAIWIDSEMRAFESEFEPAGQREESGEELLEERGVLTRNEGAKALQRKEGE